MKPLKVKVAKTLALISLGNNFIEKMLCYFSSNPSIRKNFKLGAIPLAYTSILDKLETRIAKIGNYQLYVNIAEFSGVTLYFFGEHCEPFSAALVSELVNQGDVCIDIGANVGSYTFLMADRTGSEGKVFAFEPNPDLYNLLLDSVELNQASSFICVDNKALYSKSGETLKFYLSDNPRNSGTSSLVNHGVFVSEDNFIIVKTISLTDYFKINSIEKCKLLKIDVERAELEVINGMISLLKEQRIDYIILEQIAGSESQELLHSLNYTGWLINEKNKFLINISKVQYGHFANYLFVSSNLTDEFNRNYAYLLTSEI